MTLYFDVRPFALATYILYQVSPSFILVDKYSYAYKLQGDLQLAIDLK